MSWREAIEPVSASPTGSAALERLIVARPRNVEGLPVGRVLPSPGRRLIGPFIFCDHMGPAALGSGRGVDVRPHPHIHLATVTYLFEGELVHRDSLGSHQPIRPGAINWMTAGRGIVHSERTPLELRDSGSHLHGIQLWVALPREHEETEPEFHHHPADSLPSLRDGGVALRVLAGSAYGAAAPVRIFSPLFYVEASLPAGARLPLPPEHRERAAYVVEGAVSCEAERFEGRHLLVLAPGSSPVLTAETPSRLMLFGGEPLDGPRHIWWNFVSSSKERIEQAKRDWREGRFDRVPGDEEDYVPLPE